MGTYNSAVITNGGQSMIAQAVAGASLEFTTIKTSSYAYPTGTNLATLTTINGIKQSKDITGAAVYNSRVINISSAVDNTGISTAYTINTIGIYAKVGSSAESLFAVVTASAADTMPAYDSKPYSYIYEINLTMQNAANVTVTVNTAGLVNVAGLNAAKVEIQGEIADLKSQTIHLAKVDLDFNATDALIYAIRENVTRNGVTYTWNGDGSCIVSGTATNSAYCDLYTNNNELPYWLEPQKRYNLTYSGNKVGFRIFIYENGVLNNTPICSTYTDATFVIPSSATGLIVRLNVPKNATANETVDPHIYVGMSNDDIVSELSKSIRMIKGVYDGNDADEILDNRILICDGATTAHLPDSTSAFVVETSYTTENQNNGYQIAYRFNNGKRYWRRKSIGEWSDWTVNLSVPLKYIAFGDSLTWGAVWDMDQTTSLYQAAKKYQIPTRIAHAIGMDNNFVNEAVGGSGFYSGSQSMTDKIKEYDFTDVELVTIMAGVNDKANASHPLGSADNPVTGTICGAIKEIIDWFNSNYPKVQLIFIQPTPSGHLADNWGGTLAGGWSLNTFDTEVKQLCHDNHVGYVNWWECTFCKNWNDFSGGYSYNGTTLVGPNYSHPTNELDYARLGDFIAGKVSTLFHGGND